MRSADSSGSASQARPPTMSGKRRRIISVVVKELLLEGAVEPLRVGVHLRRIRVGVAAPDTACRQQGDELALVLRAVVREHPIHRAGEQVEGEVGEVSGPTGGHPRRGHHQAEPKEERMALPLPQVRLLGPQAPDLVRPRLRPLPLPRPVRPSRGRPQARIHPAAGTPPATGRAPRSRPRRAPPRRPTRAAPKRASRSNGGRDPGPKGRGGARPAQPARELRGPSEGASPSPGTQASRRPGRLGTKSRHHPNKKSRISLSNSKNNRACQKRDSSLLWFNGME